MRNPTRTTANNESLLLAIQLGYPKHLRAPRADVPGDRFKMASSDGDTSRTINQGALVLAAHSLAL
jgi:hypothetical protein